MQYCSCKEQATQLKQFLYYLFSGFENSLVEIGHMQKLRSDHYEISIILKIQKRVLLQ